MRKKTISLGIFVAVGLALTFPTFALEFKQTYAKNIVADGQVDIGEWKAADYESNFNFNLELPIPDSSLGAVYAMGRKNYPISNSHSHDGCFFFLLHNNEWITVAHDNNYNVVHINSLAGDPKFSVWIFDDIDHPADQDGSWLGFSELAAVISPATEIDDRGFLVFNYELGEYNHWLPGDSSPVTESAYDWDPYWGFFAGSGFNNSAFTEGLPLATGGDNMVYELIYRVGGKDKCEAGFILQDPSVSAIIQGSSRNSRNRSPRSHYSRKRSLTNDWEIIDFWKGILLVHYPLLVKFFSPFAATETNLGIDLNWQIDEADRNNVAQVEVWRAVSPMGEKCPSNIEKYKLETAEKLMWVRGKEVVGPQEYTYAQGNNDDCYGLRVIESSGEENWYIESVKPNSE